MGLTAGQMNATNWYPQELAGGGMLNRYELFRRGGKALCEERGDSKRRIVRICGGLGAGSTLGFLQDSRRGEARKHTMRGC